MRSRRRGQKPPDLTSLFDVLFIVVFVALIRAAAAEHEVAEAAKDKEPPKPVVPPKPPLPVDVSKLQSQALKNVTAELAGRQPLVIRISDKGVITAEEGASTFGVTDGQRQATRPELVLTGTLS